MKDGVDLDEIEQRLERVLTAVTGSLAPERLADLRDLVRHGEPGVALENLCLELEDNGVELASELFSEIAALGSAMKLPASTWDALLRSG